MQIQPHTQRSLKHDQIAAKIKYGNSEQKEKAFKELMKTFYGHLVFYLQPSISKLEPLHAEDIAKDIAQESLIKAIKNIDSFSRYKGRFSTWIFRIARNTLIDYLRTANWKNKNCKKYIQENKWALTYGKAADEEFKRKEKAQLLQIALHSVCTDNITKTCFIDIYFNELSCEYVAQKKEIKYNTLRTRMARVRKNIKIFLETKYPEYCIN